GAKGRHLADGHLVVRWQLQPEALIEHRRDQLHLRLAEELADADPRAAAEGDVGAARQRGLALALEALGDERVGIAEDMGETVAGPGAVVHVRALWHLLARELEGAHRTAGADPGRGVEAERLVHDHL